MARRLSPEQIQENKSRGQFKAFISDCGWIVEDVQEDLGEDLIVRIFDNGESSGLSFYVQLKSVSNKTGWKDTDPYFTYPATSVADLEHWSTSTIIVVFLVWNVDANSGVWLTVPQAIKELDSKKQGWRNQKTASIHIPTSNNTTKNGIKELRVRIAEYNVPLAMNEAPLEIKTNFVFPDTEEGRKANEDFIKMLDTGEPVKLDSQFVNQVKLPDWFYRIFGNSLIKGEGAIFLGPSPYKRMTPLRLDMICDDGRISSLQYIQTHIKQSGRRQILITNERQLYPIKIEIVISEPNEEDTIGNVRFTMEPKNEWKSAFEMREVAEFLLFASQGGNLRILFYDDGHCVNNRINRGQIKIKENDIIESMQKLCIIEMKTGKNIPRAPEYNIEEKDYINASLAYQIVTTGMIKGHINEERKINLYEALNLLNNITKTGKISIVSDTPRSYLTVFGNKIEVGRKISYITIKNINIEDLKIFIAKNEESSSFLLKIEKADVIEVYPQWCSS